MTLLQYAETKKPERKRGKVVRFKGIEFERAFLIQLSDKDIDVTASQLAKVYASGMRAERDRLLREIAQLGQ